MSRSRSMILVIMLTALFCAGNTHATSYSGNCTDFYEDFSGLSSNFWSNGNGTWSMSGGALNVSAITKDKMAYSETAFYPSDHFILDVDVDPIVLSQTGAFGIRPFTSGGDLIFPPVNGRTLDGVGVILFGSGNAYLTGWETAAGSWYNTAKLATTETATSIGVEYAADAITLRINKKNTSSKVSGNFGLAYMLISKMSLVAQGGINGDTSMAFDNVCAGPPVAAPTVPAAPANLRYTTSGTMMTIQWDASAGAMGYKLGVGYSTGNYAAVTDLGDITTLGPFDISSVPAGTYYLAVKAYNADGESAYSAEKAILVTGSGLAAPTSLTYELDGKMMTIRWNSSTGATGYRMSVGMQSGQYLAPVELGNSTQLGPFNVGAVPAGIYYVAVKAYNGSGVSSYSNEVAINVGSTSMGVLTTNPAGTDGSMSGSYKITGSGTPVNYTAKSLGSGQAQATYSVPGTSETLSVNITATDKGSILWKGVTIDGNGSLSAQESAALGEIMSSGLARSLALVPLEMGCRQGSDPAAVAALLLPFQMILKYGTSSRFETAQSYANGTSCGYFPDPTKATDTRTAPTVVLLSNETPFPHVFGYFPFDEYGAVETGADKSFQSAFPVAGGGALGGCGSRCRGACGADCASLNCNKTSEWLCNVDENGKNTGERTLWVYQDCGVHEGCIWHDDCFDACKKKYGCSSWLSSNCMHNLYNGCDVSAASKYGYGNCAAWAIGMGKFESRQTFKFAEESEDNPTKCPPGQSLVGYYKGSITGGAAGVINLSVVSETSVAGNVSGIYEGDAFHGTFHGSIDADGNINATVTGTVTWESTDTDGNPTTLTFPFNGTLTGKILENLTGSGSWFAAGSSTKEIGQWTASRI